uniref:Uncharacterized protein n=1 Tax=Magallana gigas TaxID=29159 RepID=A0A8W8P1C5_MAGGI
MEKDAASQSELRAHIQIQLSLKSLSTLIRVENNRTMSEYNYSTSDPDEESQDLDLRIEETATEISGMETGPSQSPVRNQRSKKKKRIIRPMSPASEAESESILTTKSAVPMVPLRRSPRKKSALSETHRILMEKSDEETDDEGQRSFFKNARTSTPVRRSPRKQPTNNSRQLQESQSEDALDKDDNLYRKIAVKEYFANGEDMDLKWDYQKRFYDEENCELTDYIKKSVKGVAPDVANEVLEAAVKRYFTSKKEAANRKSKNKDALHKQRQATYERKKEASILKPIFRDKVRRRLQAAEKKNWGMEKKKMVTQLLKSKSAHNLMSSDEEADEGFISHPYSWESDTWRTVKESLDKKYLEVCPSRSRRLLQKRTRGSIKEQQRPDIEEEFSWIFV